MTKLARLPPSLFLALGLAVGSSAVEAADGAGSGFFSGEAVHGVITDAQTGEPIEGAVIVARWGSLAYQYRLEGSGYMQGEPLHVDEAVSDAKGRYAIRGWRREHPVAVRPDDRADPLLALFKPGYEPLVVRNDAGRYRAGRDSGGRRPSDWNGGTIRLKRWSGSLGEYATLLASFQFGGLDWMAKDAWKAMPRMVLALHQEKRRLGNDGAPIVGVDRMPGRAGAGTL
ncbi:MAG TPA: carboxypeptidase-like regulatory domain-containing protein, partial [Usitatibacter sp.]|nr:carboxypeptidase-like regulatory domain-containing protein [Usitatibacter sp.]